MHTTLKFMDNIDMKSSNSVEENTDKNKIKKSFAPYQNNHQSMQIGDLIFENQIDKVIVYGDIDIYKNEVGLAQAIQLQQVFTAIVAELQQQQSADNFNDSVTNSANVNAQTQLSDKVDNPFS